MEGPAPALGQRGGLEAPRDFLLRWVLFGEGLWLPLSSDLPAARAASPGLCGSTQAGHGSTRFWVQMHRLQSFPLPTGALGRPYLAGQKIVEVL